MHINCDLGEEEPVALGRALMACVHAVNVACGGHAGSAATMDRYAGWCQATGVLLGAHPGPWVRAGLGRLAKAPTPAELELLLLQQVGALKQIAEHHRLRLHHLKLHGALYHSSEENPALARAYVQAVVRWWPELRIIALAGGRVARLAGQAGLSVWEEAFADRRYLNKTTLVPRGQRGALLNVREAVAQTSRLFADGVIRALDGRQWVVRAQTICLHSDTPGVLTVAKQIARLLRGKPSRRSQG